MNTTKTDIYVDADGNCLIDPAAAGYVQDPKFPNGFLTRVTTTRGDYCERMASFKVCIAAVDGHYSRTFKSAKAAWEFVKARGVASAEDGFVSFDGIARLDAIYGFAAGSRVPYEIRVAFLSLMFDEVAA